MKTLIRNCRIISPGVDIPEGNILLEDGRAEYNGRYFKSLTAVADYITGTHISGYAFFNVPREKNDGE